MSELAIVGLTPRGLALGRRLATALGEGEVVSAGGAARDTLAGYFQAGRPVVCFMALGIVVRTLGPLARDKNSDPPVVVVDEGGRFAVSVLGEHVAGANALAERVARALGAVAVITTASEALGLPAVDLIGRDWGWRIEGGENLTRLAAAVVRGDPVGVYQQAGRRDWWQGWGPWPVSFQRVTAWPPSGCWAALLVISDLALPLAGLDPAVVYRPPTLVLGVGCRRGVPCAEIEAMFQRVWQAQGLSALSLGAVATAAIKADEPGLQEFVRRHGVPLRSFSLAELGGVGALPTPSAVVRSKIGIDGVAEPAAMLAASSTGLVMPKERGRRVTMALARREEA